MAAFASAAIVAAVWVGVGAAMPTFWTVATQADFLKGDVENLSIDSDGRVFLGPSTTLVAETAAPFLWTHRRGRATGRFGPEPATKARCSRSARTARPRRSSTRPSWRSTRSRAAPNNGLYVATSPDGKIYHVAADGTREDVLRSRRQVHLGARRRSSGALFAATGDKGVIYKITPDGKGARFYKTNATNVVSLAFASRAELIAGTESPGRIFRIDASGKAFVLLDSPFKEIHALRVAGDGTLYAAAVSGTQPSGEDRTARAAGDDGHRAASSDGGTTEITVDRRGRHAGRGRQVISAVSRRSNRGAVYRIRPNGLWDTLLGDRAKTRHSTS